MKNSSKRRNYSCFFKKKKITQVHDNPKRGKRLLEMNLMKTNRQIRVLDNPKHALFGPVIFSTALKKSPIPVWQIMNAMINF